MLSHQLCVCVCLCVCFPVFCFRISESVFHSPVSDRNHGRNISRIRDSLACKSRIAVILGANNYILVHRFSREQALQINVS
uniref:Putative secreted protein n=1 Tax=Anopheles darlingi TaxID=43151 RepID=A0A2M4D2N1_ANODA